MRTVLASLATVLLVVAGCGTAAAPSAAPPASPSSTAVAPSVTPVSPVPTDSPGSTPSDPSGVIAIGHSGLTGEGTGGRGQALPANSWATGTAPEVNSVWLRLQVARPDLAGEAVNRAQGGANASDLPAQAREGLRAVPHPALVIVSTIDNDIRCDGTDPQHLPEFGASVDEALHILIGAEPDVRILVVGQFGRPSIPFIKKLMAAHPDVIPFMEGRGMCDFLDPDGTPNAAHFKALTEIIDAYEAEEARVCAAVAQCRTDGGVRKAYVDVLENYAPDWAHLNVKGQAAEAGLIWPVVEGLFGR